MKSEKETAEPTAKLRLAVIGLVHGHAHRLFRQYLKRPDIKLVGIAEPDKVLAAQYVTQYGLDKNLVFATALEMFEKTKPQAAVAFTHTFDHRAVVELCARFRVPVMMEKPLATSLADAQAIAAAARKSGIAVLVNYETTWYPSHLALYNLVQQKTFGQIRRILVNDGHNGPKEVGCGPEFLSWLVDPKLGGAGALFDFGCYGANLATWLLNGQRPGAVTAVTRQFKPDIYPHVDDDATIVVTYPSAVAVFQASWNWPFSRKELEVYGQTGYALATTTDSIRVRQKGKAEEQISAAPLPSPYEDPISELKAVVLENSRPHILSSLETNITVMEILEAARQSAASGKTVSIANAL